MFEPRVLPRFDLYMGKKIIVGGGTACVQPFMLNTSYV